MELCLTQNWSEMKNTTADLQLSFHGLQASPSSLAFVSHIKIYIFTICVKLKLPFSRQMLGLFIPE